ncbi:hypothetical protein HY604_04845 [Candidatus Peregrinibacteria bacterium]|nr:hypothetical protein [Candidatus Peregrinibacteria bacterium]
MKKSLSFLLATVIFTLTFAPAALAAQIGDGHTAREEAEGKEIWNKLKAGELKCDTLTDENFGALGEYFMGRMASDSHEAMNNMMTAMMGEDGEEKMHVAL